MIIEKAQPQSPAKTIKSALATLKKGGVIMHATETCYGFACDALNRKAISRLYKLKKMNRLKPSSIMVANFIQAKKYGKFGPLASRLAKKYWPGPLTIIVPRYATLPHFLNPATKTIGIRCPAHALTLKILRAYKQPLITTSANISGKKEAYSVHAFLKSMPKNAPAAPRCVPQGGGKAVVPDLIIDSGTIPKRKPSTIIAIEKNNIKILRQGGVKI